MTKNLWSPGHHRQIPQTVAQIWKHSVLQDFFVCCSITLPELRGRKTFQHYNAPVHKATSTSYTEPFKHLWDEMKHHLNSRPHLPTMVTSDFM